MYHPVEWLRYGKLLECAGKDGFAKYLGELNSMERVTVIHKCTLSDKKIWRSRRKSNTSNSTGPQTSERIGNHVGNPTDDRKRVEIRKRTYGTIIDYSNHTYSAITRDIYIIQDPLTI